MRKRKKKAVEQRDDEGEVVGAESSSASLVRLHVLFSHCKH